IDVWPQVLSCDSSLLADARRQPQPAIGSIGQSGLQSNRRIGSSIMRPCARSFVVPSVVAVLALSAQTGWSETKTIKIVVPNPPGASTDILARLLAEQIGRAEGATLVIENRSGAGNIVGSEAVARAVPDGKTLLINANPFVIDSHLRRLSY